jgi:hypothetical protein
MPEQLAWACSRNSAPLLQRAPIAAELATPLTCPIGSPVGLRVTVSNRTSRTETISMVAERSEQFAFAGLAKSQFSVRFKTPMQYCVTN